MLCINQEGNDPYFNIATEEYLLKNYSDDILMLYVNEPSVIVGKHQNTFAEVSYRLAKDKKVKIVRRLSGGGAVYHDLGNLNFTFIKNSIDGNLVDFRGFTKPIIDLLNELGVDARFEGHNSLNVGGKKISGNAEHVYKNRVMHHGTLLFSTDMQMLADMLYISDDLYSDKAVKSVRANTTNLSEHLPPEITLEKFREHVIEYMTKKHSNLTLYSLTKEDNVAIYDLVEKKYNTWQWNFGYSPSYKFSRSFTLKGKRTTIAVEVQKGVLSNVNVKGDTLSAFEKGTIESSLTGCNHMEVEIEKHLNGTLLTTEMQQKILEALF
ncbi:MAG: lipoate--protein ligase [Bacteroidales bacterium]|nr:lipoate--protein ligase [Bacteroidales bacterium]MDY0253214.1 lipoate--protein ligase [Tenuifilaceae bacterium]